MDLGDDRWEVFAIYCTSKECWTNTQQPFPGRSLVGYGTVFTFHNPTLARPLIMRVAQHLITPHFQRQGELLVPRGIPACIGDEVPEYHHALPRPWLAFAALGVQNSGTA